MSNPLTNLNVKRIHELLELLSPAMAHELVIDDSEGVLKPKRLSLSNLANLLVPYNGAVNDVDLGAHDIKTPNYTEALSLATLAEREYLAVALSKLAKVTSVVIAQLDGKSAYRGTLLASGYNLNDIAKTGTYTAPANAVNSPVFSEAVSEINYIMHINSDSATTSAVQLAIGATTSHIYLRNKIGNTWSAWSIGITPTEIGYLKSVTSNVQAQLNALATNKQNISDKTNVWSEEPNDQRYPSEKLVKDSLDAQEARIAENESDIATNISDIGDLELAVAGIDEDIIALDGRLDTTEGEIDTLQGEIVAHESRLGTTELTIARQGQDLASVKQTLQQGNGATLDFSDVGIVPLDARATGRANPTVKGRTATNLSFEPSQYSISSNVTLENGVFHFLPTGDAFIRKYDTGSGSIPFNTTDIFVILADVTIISGSILLFNDPEKIFTGAWRGTLSSLNVSVSPMFDNDSNSSEAYLSDIRIVNLTSIYGAGNEPNLETCQKIFSYFDGTKSISMPARLRSVGRNLFDKSTVKVVKNSYYSTTTGEVLPSTSYFRLEGIKVLSGVISMSSTWVISRMLVYKGGIFTGNTSTTSSIDTGDGDTIKIHFYKGEGFTQSEIDTIVDNLQVSIGSSSLPYEPYTDSTLYIADNEEVRSVQAVSDTVSVVNGEHMLTKKISTPVSVASGVAVNVTNYPTAKTGGKFAVELTAGGTQIGVIGTDSTSGAGTLRFELATPVTTNLLTSGILQAKQNGTVYFEPWYEGSHQTNASSKITLPYEGTIEAVYGYDEDLVEYLLDSSEYSLTGTTLTITDALENEVYYVELSRSEPLAPEISVNTLNNMVVPTIVNASTYTVLEGDHTLLVSRTATGACAITIPSALIASYKRLVVKDSGGLANTNNITLSTEGAEKIDGADTYVINTAKGKVELASDGANMWVVG